MSHTAKNVVSSENKWLHRTARALTVVVAAAAAILSFDALTQLAIAAGISPALGWIWAVLVDGFILIATISVFALRKRNKKALAWAFFILGLFVFISIIGNGLHPILIAEELQLSGTPELDGGKLPFWAAVAVTAVPPIALFLAIHLMTVMITPSSDQEKALVKEEQKAAKESKISETVTSAKTATLQQTANKSQVKPVAFPQPSITSSSTALKAAPTVVKEPEEKVQSETSLTPEPPNATTAPSSQSAVKTRSHFSTEEQVFLDRLEAGEHVTGQQVADAMGLKLRAGQSRLKKMRLYLESIQAEAS